MPGCAFELNPANVSAIAIESDALNDPLLVKALDTYNVRLQAWTSCGVD
jgi:hypothetical protein